MKHRLPGCLGLAALIIGCLGLFVPSAHADDVDEYKVKGAFLYNFLKYVEWSDTDHVRTHDTLVIVIAGEDPLGPDFDAALDGRTIDDHPVAVMRVSLDEPLPTCHLLFTICDDVDVLRDLLRKAQADNVLTVGEAEDFFSLGGIMRLVVSEGRIRFDVDMTNAERTTFSISATLLSLARHVVRDEAE